MTVDNRLKYSFSTHPRRTLYVCSPINCRRNAGAEAVGKAPKGVVNALKKCLLIGLLATAFGAQSQVMLAPDTLQCHVIGFSASALMPGWGSSTAADGGSMKQLYKGPYLDFAIGCDYKYASGWLVSLDADLWFGNDNLQERTTRLGDIYSPSGYPIAADGVQANVEAYNRNIAVRLGLGRIVNVLPRNPNSGLLFKLGAGWMMQKTAFNQEYTESPVPLLDAENATLYDHLRNGVILTESVGFIYMSNYLTYVNFRITAEVSQCWSWSSRGYQIDNLMGLNGRDNGRYFDLVYGIKLTWMFPLMGKPNYDYYY